MLTPVVTEKLARSPSNLPDREIRSRRRCAPRSPPCTCRTAGESRRPASRAARPIWRPPSPVPGRAWARHSPRLSQPTAPRRGPPGERQSRQRRSLPRAAYERPANPFVMGFVGPVSRLGDSWVRPHDREILEDPDDGAIEGARRARREGRLRGPRRDGAGRRHRGPDPRHPS